MSICLIEQKIYIEEAIKKEFESLCDRKNVNPNDVIKSMILKRLEDDARANIRMEGYEYA